MYFAIGRCGIGIYQRLEFSITHDTIDWDYWRVSIGPVTVSWWK